MEMISSNASRFVRGLPLVMKSPAPVPRCSISRSATQPHIALSHKPSTSPISPGLAGKRWPGSNILSNVSMQVIARKYQRTPLQVWQRYQVQCGVPGANAGSDEHRGSINTFALTMEEMKEVSRASTPGVIGKR